MGADEVADDYKTSLVDLNFNSKPLITVLTMLADENKDHATAIVQVIVSHVKQTGFKLPVMYLIDSIVKNVGGEYKRLLGNSIANVFASVFKDVDERTRKKLYELRQTWNEVFPKSRLFQLDTSVREIDPAWPITAHPRITTSGHTIHVNPNKFMTHAMKPGSSLPAAPAGTDSAQAIEELKRLQNEKRVLEETRRKVEKIMKETESTQLKASENPVPMEHAIPSLDREALLSKYKIKKREPPANSVTGKTKEKGSNIYVAPWKAKDLSIIQPTSTSKDSRSQDLKNAKNSTQTSTRPASNRDPRLASKPVRIAPVLPVQIASSESRDPRVRTTVVPEPEPKPKKDVDSRPKIQKVSAPTVTKTKETGKGKEKVDKDRDSHKSRENKVKESVKSKEKDATSEKSKDKDKLKERDKSQDKVKEREKSAAADKLREKLKLPKSKEKEKSLDKSKERDKSIEKPKEKEKSSKTKDKEEKTGPKEKDKLFEPPKEKSVGKSKEKSKFAVKPEKAVPKEKDKLFEKPEKFVPKDKFFEKPEKTVPKDKLFEKPEKTVPKEKDKLFEPYKVVENSSEQPIVKDKPVEKPKEKSKTLVAKDKQDKKSQEAEKLIVKPEMKTDPDDDLEQKGSSSVSGVAEKPMVEDLDLRKLSGSQMGAQSLGGSDILFGKEDVDLRKLPMAGVPMGSHLPPTTAASSAPNPFLAKPDEDLRVMLDHRKPPAEVEPSKGDPFTSGQSVPGPLADQDHRLKKTAFNSPHADKWKQFRDVNPEFKEYQRQASASETSADSQDKDTDLRRRRSSFKSSGPSDQWNSEGSPLLESETNEGGDERQAQNYNQMIDELTEQRSKGDLSEDEYRRSLTNVRMMAEEANIRKLKARDGDRSDFGRSRPPADVEDSDGRWSRSYSGRHEQGHRGKWDRHGSSKRDWNRPRGKMDEDYRGHRRGVQGSQGRFEEEYTGEPDLPSIPEDDLRAVYRESETRSIDIDGRPREIRTYGDRAVVLLGMDDPRLISFDPIDCRIVFDGGQFMLPMRVGEDYREFHIDGEVHRVKLGVPTQELMIDGKGYQCFFGGKPITVHLAGRNRTISLDGRPPSVVISPHQHFNYLLGKIELVINARKIVPLYLDAKPQRFSIDGKAFVLKFTDNFQSVLINGIRFPVEYGDLPITISVRGYKQFLRFSKLPNHVIPGETSVKGMDRDDSILIPTYPPSPPPALLNPPVFMPPLGADVPPGIRPQQGVNSNIPNLPPPPFPPNQPFNFPVQGGPTPPFQPAPLPPTQPPAGVVPGSYMSATPVDPTAAGVTLPDVTVPPPSSNPPNIDLSSLLDRLVQTGIISGASKKDKTDTQKPKKDDAEPEEVEEEDNDDLKGLPPQESMFNLDNLRKRNKKLVSRLYRGMQCSSCGLRYPSDQTQLYSQHLDWHFRLNKKQQDSTRKVSTRKFYLCFDDWIQYEEIEEEDVRVPSMFEMEGQSGQGPGSDDETVKEDAPSVSVSASSSDSNLGVCPVCHETFDQFYHHGHEAWHYKYAVHVDGSNYHPGCHQDLLKRQEAEVAFKEAEAASKEAEAASKVAEASSKEAEAASQEADKKEESEVVEDVEMKQKEDVPVIVEEAPTEAVEKEAEAPVEISPVSVIPTESIQPKPPTPKKEEEIEVVDEDEEVPTKDDEDIQEIEKEVDNTPKIEIDLTSDDGPREVKSVEGDSQETKGVEAGSLEVKDVEGNPQEVTEIEDEVTRKEKRKQRNLARNRESFGPMLIETPKEIRIKDEPVEEDDLQVQVFLCTAPTPLLADIPIKVEIVEDEVDPDAPFIVVDDEITDPEVVATSTWLAPQPTAKATTDIASSIDGNTDLTVESRVNQRTSTGPRIKISFNRSNPGQQQTEDSNEKDRNWDDKNGTAPEVNGFEEFVAPPITIDYTKKPSFKGVLLDRQPAVHRGMEMSSLCSIM